jgi:hypothetical protein
MRIFLFLTTVFVLIAGACPYEIAQESKEDGITDARTIILDSTIRESVINNEADKFRANMKNTHNVGAGIVSANKITVVSIPYSQTVSHAMNAKISVPFVKNGVSEKSGLGDIVIGVSKHHGALDEPFGRAIFEARATLPTGNEENLLGSGALNFTLSASTKKSLDNAMQALANFSYTFYPRESKEYELDYGSTFMLVGGIERNCMLLEKTRSRIKVAYITKESDSADGISIENSTTALELYATFLSKNWLKNYPLEAGFRFNIIHDEGKNTNNTRSLMLYVNGSLY